MKKEISPIVLVSALVVVVIGLGVGIYLFVRPEPVKTRKGVPWEGRTRPVMPGEQSFPGGERRQGVPPPVPH